MSYKFNKNDISYEDEKIVIIVKDLEVMGNIGLSFNLIELGLNNITNDINILKKDKKELLNGFIKRLRKLNEK